MIAPIKFQFVQIPFVNSMKQDSFTETLQRERAHLLRAANDSFENWQSSDGKGNLDQLLTAATALRQSISDILKRQAADIRKNDLIRLQSVLHEALDERFQSGVKEYFERRFKTLNDQVRRDPLTGLFNRAAFDERINEEVARALRYGRHLALMMFDIDDFKSVNDRFGHQEGDRALIHVARVLQASFRLSDPVFRYGGDEFVALCPETTGTAMETASKRIENQRMLLSGEDEFLQSIKISWGIASLPTDAVNVFDLIQMADQRLYHLKRERHLPTV